MIRSVFLFSLLALQVAIHSSGWAQSDEGSSRSSFGSSSMVGLIPISVTIGGDFPFAGSYQAAPTERIDLFITRIVNAALTQSRELTFWEKSGMSRWGLPLRGLVIRRADGTTIPVDLLKYRLTGDLSMNPYLRNDDFIQFPVYKSDRNFVSVYGAVKRPGRVQFVEGDRLADVIQLVDGFDTSHETVDRIEISRLNQAGTREEIISVSPNAEVPLQMGDRIRVVAADKFKYDYKILVVGEVFNPGFISITRNTTTLHEVLKKAGGLKPDGSLDYARYFSGATVSGQLRKAIEDTRIQTEGQYLGPLTQYLSIEPQLNIMEMARMSSLTVEDSATFSLDNQVRLLQQGDFVDLTGLPDPASAVSQTIVQDGDVIIIPKKPTSVYVFGQVKRIGNLPYIAGKDFQFYIEQSGGLGEEATGEIYVIKGKSRSWLKVGEQSIKLEPGDFIWAAKEVKRPFSYWLNVAGGVSAVIGSVATVMLLIIQLGK